MDETFSSIDLVTQCLFDVNRTSKFKEAIFKTVKKGDVVLDAGTGSSILALFAAAAGAKKVTAIEFDPYVAKLAYENVLRNNLEKVVNIFLGDARTVNFEDGTIFDVVIMEMLTTGMVDEYQVWTANNLHWKGFVNEKTIFLPKRQDTFIVPVSTDYTAYGFEMRMVKHLWEGFPAEAPVEVAEKQLLNSISFNQTHELHFSKKLSFVLTKDAVINGVYLTSQSILTDDQKVEDTLSLNAPVIVPLLEDIHGKRGATLNLEISYDFGNGYRNFNIKIV